MYTEKNKCKHLGTDNIQKCLPTILDILLHKLAKLPHKILNITISQVKLT